MTGYFGCSFRSERILDAVMNVECRSAGDLNIPTINLKDNNVSKFNNPKKGHLVGIVQFVSRIPIPMTQSLGAF